MTDTSDPSTPATAADEHLPPLDVAAEQAHLDELGKEIAETRKHAKADLEVGGAGRTFTDEGVALQVEREGDTEHPAE